MTVRRLRAFTALGAVLSLALAAQGAVVSNASWTDREWDYAAIGAVDCANPEGAFLTRGAGQMLSGGLLGIDLDTVAEASGVVVTNDGTRALHTPSSAQPAPADPAYADPLNVALLNDAISLDLSTYLQLPLDNSTGLIGQYARADIAGDATGASGLITESGGIATQPGAGYPHLATLQLSTLLDAVGYDLGQLLAGVTDLSLEIGAVTGRAELDGCEEYWSDSAQGVTREYLATSLDLALETPTLRHLTDQLDSIVLNLENTVNGLTGNSGVIQAITGGVTSLLGPVLGALNLGAVTVTLSAEVDTQALRDLINPQNPLTDSAGVLAIYPGAERIVINTAALLESAYPGQHSNGLNGLAPNTNLLSDPQILNTLATTLSQILEDWLGEIDDLLDETIDGVSVNAQVIISLSLLLVSATITADVSGSLLDLLAGDGTVSLNVAGLLDVGLLVSPLRAGLGAVVGEALEATLSTLRVLPSTVTDLLAPIMTAVSGAYTSLFLDEVVSLTINNQNHPATGAPAPADWAPLPPGQYDVAAIRVGVVDALGLNSVHFYLGRGSVGPTCSRASPTACADY